MRGKGKVHVRISWYINATSLGRCDQVGGIILRKCI